MLAYVLAVHVLSMKGLRFAFAQILVEFVVASLNYDILCCM
jgi:hypothetical protein